MPAVDDALAVRDEFIQCLLLRPEPTPNAALLEQMALTAYLVSPAASAGPSVEDFIYRLMPVLLRQLRRVAEPERVELQGAVRGRVDWAATHRRRLSQASDPQLFICRQTRRQYATPENELLVYVLQQLQQLLTNVPPYLHTGAYRVNNRFVPLETRLARLQTRLRQYRQHIYLREIPVPTYISSRHLLKAETSKTEWYGQLAKFYTASQTLLTSLSPEACMARLRETPLLPGTLTPPGDAVIQLTAWMLTH